MANETDIAILTDRVAQAMYRARGTLDSVADSLQDKNYGRLLDNRLEDIAQLRSGADRVREAEFEAGAQGRLAAQTQDRGDVLRWQEADDQVRRSFNYAAQDAGDLGSRIGRAQGELEELHDDLSRSSAFLDQALKDVDTLQQFPEYGTEAADQLRTRVTNLKNLTNQTDAGLKTAYDQLGNARATAFQLERTTMQVGDNAHSTAIRDASTSLTADVNRTRDGLTDVRQGIDAKMHDVNAMAQYGVDEANRAAELENAVRAGTNPTTAAEQAGADPSAGNGVQDPRLRFMQRPGQESATGRGE
jgi:ABC-type transporter Mla subunit MlaD